MESDGHFALQRLQTEILEAIALGAQFEAIANLLCARVESLAPGVTCSMLLVDENGRLRSLAGPSLPAHYCGALDGLRIGPNAGSCGTAAWRGEPVEVTDIEVDPLWSDFAHLALDLGLKACWSSPIRDSAGRVVATFAFYYDVRRGPSEFERQMVEACVHLCTISIDHTQMLQRNHHLAYFDQLTNLPNRRCFDEAITALALGTSPSFGLILVDIDHLKTINDSMGHLVGDCLIREVAERLRGTQGDNSAYRLSGDEFAVVCDPCDDHAELRRIALGIRERMNIPFDGHGNMIVPQVTLGGVVYGPDGCDADALRQNADFALYHAKETHRGTYVAFDAGLRTTMMRRGETIRAVDLALTEDRIRTYYQPIVRLDTAEVVGLEALARMVMPDGQIVPAGTFAAALSDNKVASRLSDRMFARIARDLAAWIGSGLPFQHVGINLAAADFDRGDLETRLLAPLEAAGVPFRHLVVEVTENVFLDGLGENVAESLTRLRSKGVLVALDDFGTGFASLTHLLKLPVDIIKIDRSFVDLVLTDAPSSAIIEGLMGIAEKLGMRVVAEGIENAGQAERLNDFGYLLGQGYHFARPADFDSTTKLLKLFAQRLPPTAEPPAWAKAS
ncbi:EAL domain-containing protein [Aurantimonas sp. A2-1-M11]|uniref:putative bifunctional diguanylate cyclase/phosphodiesterase n=1 Tax=Aurantimonas sp. A2-1-M11 TaxID=3113712 RepID=UPI002F93F90A